MVDLQPEQKIFKLSACSHTFCRECFQETFHSLIIEQNRHDDLKCPQHGCDSVPTIDEIEKLVSPEVFKKYKQFQDNQRVARDKANLMFCTAPNCDQVLDLREASKTDNQDGGNRIGLFQRKKRSRLIECQKCQNRICRECRQAFHGESGKCQDVNNLENWSKEKSGIEVGTCPNCSALVEKNGGCPHMTCYVCKYDWCWTCGLHRRHVFHKMQILSGETGILCEFINKVGHRGGRREEMVIKSLAVRYFLIFILFLIGPPLLLAGGLVAGVIIYPFFPFIYVILEGHRCCRCAKKIKVLYITLCFFLALSLYVVTAILGVLATIVAALIFVLFYVLCFLLTIRMIFVQCCKSKKTSKKQKDKIEMMVEQRKQENQSRRQRDDQYERNMRARERLLQEQRIIVANMRPGNLHQNADGVGEISMAAPIDDDEIIQRVIEQSLKEHQEAQVKILEETNKLNQQQQNQEGSRIQHPAGQNLTDASKKVIMQPVSTSQIPSKQLKDEDDSIIDPGVDDSDSNIDPVKMQQIQINEPQNQPEAHQQQQNSDQN